MQCVVFELLGDRVASCTMLPSGLHVGESGPANILSYLMMHMFLTALNDGLIVCTSQMFFYFPVIFP